MSEDRDFATFDAMLEDALEGEVAYGADPMELARHVEEFIANWQEQYK